MVAALGACIGFLMILMKVIPALPGHFTQYEWLALVIWILAGVLLHWRARPSRASQVTS